MAERLLKYRDKVQNYNKRRIDFKEINILILKRLLETFQTLNYVFKLLLLYCNDLNVYFQSKMTWARFFVLNLIYDKTNLRFMSDIIINLMYGVECLPTIRF